MGKEANDNIIADNSAAKSYGGGYFFRVHNENVSDKYVDALLIAESGNVAFTHKLEAKEIKVTNTPTADFVFEKDYKLPTLEEVEKKIQESKHLPQIASAAEMQNNGVNVGEFQIQLLQKIEELTLYVIQQNKENNELKHHIEQLEKTISTQISK